MFGVCELDKDFLWGGASAANQMEGGYDLDGRGMSIADVFMFYEKKERHLAKKELTIEEIKKLRENKSNNFPKRRGNDFYHHYQEDIALLAKMGIKAFRMSFSWSRIFPRGDEKEPNKAGLKFYDNIINELLKYKIEPIITLSHFETPLVIATEYGGWCNKEVIKFFQTYCYTVFTHFKGRIKYWMSFNEINAALEIPFKGSAIPFSQDRLYETQVHQGLYNQFLASALVTRELKRIDKTAKMGCMIASFTTYPASCDPDDILKAMRANQEYYLYADVQANGNYPNWYLKNLEKRDIHLNFSKEELDIIKNNTVDYISFSYYLSLVASHDPARKVGEGNLKGGVENPYLEKSDWGWAIDPIGLRITMNEIYYRYNLPILISENGFGANDILTVDNQIHDEYRIKYLQKHINELKKAIELDGVICLGYLSWSPIDMISAGTSEMNKRYGYIYVDYDDYGNGSGKRYLKDSFYWYQKAIASNGKVL